MRKDRNVLLVGCVLVFLGVLNALTFDDASEGASAALYVLVVGGSWLAWLLRSRSLRLAGLLTVLAGCVALSIIGDNVIQTIVSVAMGLFAIATMVSEIGGERTTRGGKPASP